jgi:probable O-glycosylation ligase (exosortase A-associated)
LLAIVVLISCARLAPLLNRVLGNPLGLTLVLIQLPFIVSAFTAAASSSAALLSYQGYIRPLLIAFMIPLVIETVEDMRDMLLVMGFSIGFIGSKFGTHGLISGGVHWSGGYTGFMSDNNTLAIALAMAVPLCWYARSFAPFRWMKLMYLAMVCATTAAVVMTLSRGAILALGVGLIKISWHSKHKFRVLAALAALALPSVYLMQDELTERMQTLEAPTEDRSANSRIEQLKLAARIWPDYPLFGVGFGGQNFQIIASRIMGTDKYHMVHNSFVQMLVDNGLFAFLMYTGMMCGSIWWLGRSAKRLRQFKKGLEAYPLAVQTSLIVFAVCGLTHPRAYFDFGYMLLLSAAAWWNIERSPAFAALPVPAAPPPRPVVRTGIPGPVLPVKPASRV